MSSSGRLRWFLGITVVLAAVFVFVPRFPQDPDYHRFADQRALLGIPRALDVTSNLPFLFVGLTGVTYILRRFVGEFCE